MILLRVKIWISMRRFKVICTSFMIGGGSGDDDDGSNMPLEGLNAALKNSFKLPVIFYGGNADKANFLVELLNLGKRIDIGWIKNPYNYKSLFVIVEKIKFGFV